MSLTIQQNTPSGRIAYISFLQILGAVLVILYHSFHEYPGDYESLTAIHLFQTVRMPLFTFISGFLFALSMSREDRYPTLGGFVKEKAQRLLLPFLVLETLAFIPRSSLSFMAEDEISMSWESYLRSLILKDDLTVVVLWFLPMIFLLLVSGYIVTRASRRYPAAGALTATVAAIAIYLLFADESILYIGLFKLPLLAVFFVAGTLYGYHRHIIDRCLERPWQLPVWAVIWLALFFCPMEGKAINLVTSIAGVATMLSLALNVSTATRLWIHLDGMNYMMYLLSWFTCVASQQVLHHFTDFPWWVYTATAVLSSIYIPWAIGRTLQHLAPTSKAACTILWLLGHNAKKYRRQTPAVISSPAASQPVY